MKEDDEKVPIYEELSKPILTSDPNLRAWIRDRRMAAAWARKAELKLETVKQFSRTPWGEVRPAAADDVIAGAVLWGKIPGQEGKVLGADGHAWYFVERVSEEPGKFVDQDGALRSSEGLLAEVHTQEALKKADRVMKSLGGERHSYIGTVAAMDIARGRTDATLYVSEEFHGELTKEVAELGVTVDQAGVTSLFGTRIVVDRDLEHTAMRFESRATSGEYDPDGLKVRDLKESADEEN